MEQKMDEKSEEFIKQETLAFFNSIPLCAPLLSDPASTILPIASIGPHDPFFRKTAHFNDGVLRSLFLYHNSSPPGPAEGHLMIQIGAGICGQANIAHGGFLATVMDEVSGTLIASTKLDEGLGMFTVALNTSYQRPVFAPAVIMASSRVAKIEGRKVFIEATIRDQEGNVCTTAEAIFVKKKPGSI